MKKPKSIDEPFNEFINELQAETPENRTSLKQFIEFEKQCRYINERIEARLLIEIFTSSQCKLIKYRVKCNEVKEIAKKMGWTSGATQNKINELANNILENNIFDCPKKEPKDVLTWVYYEYKNFFEKNRKYFDMDIGTVEHKKIKNLMNRHRMNKKIIT